MGIAYQMDVITALSQLIQIKTIWTMMALEMNVTIAQLTRITARPIQTVTTLATYVISALTIRLSPAVVILQGMQTTVAQSTSPTSPS